MGIGWHQMIFLEIICIYKKYDLKYNNKKDL